LKFIPAQIYFTFCFWAIAAFIHPAWAQEPTSGPPIGTSEVTVNQIFIVGNEKTRRNVILREMDIAEGATYTWNQFNELVVGDQIKIYNLQLFTSVTVTPLFIAEDQVELLVSVKERWYVIPSIIFSLADRNFSEWWINQGRDLSRVNYGLKLSHNNVAGRNEKLRIAGQLGFTQAFDINYIKPYIDKEQLHGLSARFSFFTNRNIAIRSVNNKQVFYTNDREDVLRKSLNTSLTYTYRGSFYNFHYLTLGFSNTSIHEDVLTQNPNYFAQGDERMRFFYTEYSYKHDRRNNVAYATDGELLNVGITRYGLFAHDDVNETEISLLANKYFPLDQKFHLVTGLSASSYLSPSQPYTLVRGIGYNPNFIRGFEVNVIEGQQAVVHKSSFRYELLNIAYDISSMMPIEEFSHFPIRAYLSANFDHGYVNDRNRLPENAQLTNTYLYGYGLGLDLVTFYDQVFRFEYSVNSLGTGNFFINVRAPL
jgi:outer membrane protein assembly factor BamA